MNNTTYKKPTTIDEGQKMWADANKAGDKAGMESAHKGTEELRAKLGYLGGEDGTKHDRLVLNPPQNNFTAVGKNTQAPAYNASMSPEIMNLQNAQKNAAIAKLKSAVNQKVSGYNEKIAGLEPQYQDMRNQSEVERYKAARAMRENLANSGELSGGAGRQDMLNMQNAYSGRLGALNMQQQQQTDSYGRAIADARTQGELSEAMMASQYDAAVAQMTLEERKRYEDRLYQREMDDRNSLYREADITGQFGGQQTRAAMNEDRNFNYKAGEDNRDFGYNRFQDDRNYEAEMQQREAEMKQREKDNDLREREYQHNVEMDVARATGYYGYDKTLSREENDERKRQFDLKLEEEKRKHYETLEENKRQHNDEMAYKRSKN